MIESLREGARVRAGLIDKRRARLFAIVICCGWILSLCLSAATLKVGPGDPRIQAGYDLLLIGWIGVIVWQIGWFANLLLPIMLAILLFPDLRLNRPMRFLRMALILLMSLCTLDSLDLMIRPDIYGTVHLHAGYYVWMAVNCFATAVALLIAVRPAADVKVIAAYRPTSA